MLIIENLPFYCVGLVLIIPNYLFLEIFEQAPHDSALFQLL